MIDVVHGKKQLIVVTLGSTAKLAATIGQNSQKIDAFLLKHRQYAIVQQIRRRDRALARVQLASGDLAVRINEGLLIDPTNALDRSHVVRVLGSQISWVLSLDLAMRLVRRFLALQRNDLSLGEYETLFRHFLLQHLQAELAILKRVAQPDAANSTGRYEDALFPEIVADAHLAMSRILQRERKNGILYLLIDSILRIGLAPCLVDQGLDTGRLSRRCGARRRDSTNLVYFG
jgi:hypothetical protein